MSGVYCTLKGTFPYSCRTIDPICCKTGAREVIYLIVAYAKSDKADLTAGEKKMFSALIEELTHD